MIWSVVELRGGRRVYQSFTAMDGMDIGIRIISFLTITFDIDLLCPSVEFRHPVKELVVDRRKSARCYCPSDETRCPLRVVHLIS